MLWNWELPNWPKFSCDPKKIAEKEKKFLFSLGSMCALLKNIDRPEYNQFVIEILSSEGLKSSKIEGEILDRQSLQSSIKQQFGLSAPLKKEDKESNMAKLLCSVYESFKEPLSHEMLLDFHLKLFNDKESGKYRSHKEAMQIVSNRYGSSKVFFEAPPSKRVPKEMDTFIEWFNSTKNSLPILERAALSHVYFETIHPFEDGNGRIGRILVEKVLSQGIEKPVLIAVSRILEKRRKEYYAALEQCNRTLNIHHFVEFFSDVILEAQEESMNLLLFLINKTKMLSRLSEDLNPRQEKVLLKMFSKGLSGFKGGLSAKNYISITKTSKATATRDLADLVKKGALKKSGELKHSRYTLNLDSLLS